MKIVGLITAICFAVGTWAAPVAADPWKDESGHGRWEKRGDYKDYKKFYKEQRKHYRKYSRDYRPRYYRGYRGYREYRPGYRRYDDGWWYPLAAFAAGAIAGGALGQPAPTYRAPQAAGSAHVEWCYSRYRSYRAYDNTFQPYHGPRKPCISPYY